MSNFATKSDLKSATSVDTWTFAQEADLVSFKTTVDELDADELNGLNSVKSKVDELDVDKLATVPVDLKKISDVVDKKSC